ncbi:centrosomal protein of 19 kDa [Pristis pectinata]|uniref:centrosomal protein of 19 kDa n=1 Tax=Pristis pectinata TaxID=685728 RepID=UPI00223D8C70|nr:centrosomal protein of 19 kDa [Pristis pectinata]XP_051874147.1 centrosomal protein of 19 kDa [Pristis pectinata]XP_051874148.1 centrosomal protein of 19 kDa [Pristis pectinata]XP_051874150.1 centrosomal protein of 19 kDa [Pristis pectinata]XP_051874151.1 centrosomal protein of 19 kDa [Pristis pectinata]
MTYIPRKCGVKFKPPTIVLIYEDESTKKTRQRLIPIRNFSRFSDCSRAAEAIKNNPRHQVYLDGVSQQQLQKLFQLLRDNLNGVSLEKSLEAFVRMNSINPEEDLNKLDDNELAKKKKIMDELFEKNRRKPNDPEFVYDLEVDFPQDGLIESCGWDEEEQDGEI